VNAKNQLYYGDNYEVLQRYIKDESVDLIHLDPPFNSRQDLSKAGSAWAEPRIGAGFFPQEKAYIASLVAITLTLPLLYNVLFAEKDGSQSSSQIHAFEDTRERNIDAQRPLEHIIERGGRAPTPCASSTPSSAAAT